MQLFNILFLFLFSNIIDSYYKYFEIKCSKMDKKGLVKIITKNNFMSIFHKKVNEIRILKNKNSDFSKKFKIFENSQIESAAIYNNFFSNFCFNNNHNRNSFMNSIFFRASENFIDKKHDKYFPLNPNFIQINHLKNQTSHNPEQKNTSLVKSINTETSKPKENIIFYRYGNNGGSTALNGELLKVDVRNEKNQDHYLLKDKSKIKNNFAKRNKIDNIKGLEDELDASALRIKTNLKSKELEYNMISRHITFFISDRLGCSSLITEKIKYEGLKSFNLIEHWILHNNFDNLEIKNISSEDAKINFYFFNKKFNLLSIYFEPEDFPHKNSFANANPSNNNDNNKNKFLNNTNLNNTVNSTFGNTVNFEKKRNKIFKKGKYSKDINAVTAFGEFAEEPITKNNYKRNYTFDIDYYVSNVILANQGSLFGNQIGNLNTNFNHNIVIPNSIKEQNPNDYKGLVDGGNGIDNSKNNFDKNKNSNNKFYKNSDNLNIQKSIGLNGIDYNSYDPISLHNNNNTPNEEGYNSLIWKIFNKNYFEQINDLKIDIVFDLGNDFVNQPVLFEPPLHLKFKKTLEIKNQKHLVKYSSSFKMDAQEVVVLNMKFPLYFKECSNAIPSIFMIGIFALFLIFLIIIVYIIFSTFYFNTVV